jgi:hypothetical protein
MTEERLNELARTLGTRAAERLDVQAAARAVVQRLREEPAPRVRWIHQTWLRIAAALILVLGGGLVVARVISNREPPAPTHVAHFVVDDLSGFSTEELQDVLASLDTLLTDSAVSDSAADLLELDAQQLRAMLRSLEG